MTTRSYRDLVVWKKSMLLVKTIYQITQGFPKSEQYGLTSQMRRASISIPSNIAEGSRRSSRKDFRNFVLTAYGSGAELETQLEIAKELGYIGSDEGNQILNTLEEIMKMLNALAQSLNKQKTTHYSLQTTNS